MEEKKRFIRFDYMTNNEVGLPLDLYVSEIRRFGSKAYRIAERGLLNKALQVFHKKEEMKRVCGGRDKIKPFIK